MVNLFMLKIDKKRNFFSHNYHEIMIQYKKEVSL